MFGASLIHPWRSRGASRNVRGRQCRCSRLPGRGGPDAPACTRREVGGCARGEWMDGGGVGLGARGATADVSGAGAAGGDSIGIDDGLVRANSGRDGGFFAAVDRGSGGGGCLCSAVSGGLSSASSPGWEGAGAEWGFSGGVASSGSGWASDGRGVCPASRAGSVRDQRDRRPAGEESVAGSGSR